MDGTVFDTLRVTKILRDAGIGEAQAEAITESIGVALTGGVATKADLAAMEVRVYRYVHRYMWIVAGTAVSLNVTLTVALLKWLP